MKEETHHHRLFEEKRHVSAAINQLAIGIIILVWGSLLTLKQVGLIEKNVSTWPFVLTAFGALLIFGGIYKLYAREKTGGEDVKEESIRNSNI
ncbi:MAG TPA: hypothetical protein VJ249_00325 [Candidatus Bathyarchaeia archaeon]|nr:hypothetical protein [Candidatus Bathyarchaeia archaeon]